MSGTGSVVCLAGSYPEYKLSHLGRESSDENPPAIFSRDADLSELRRSSLPLQSW